MRKSIDFMMTHPLAAGIAGIFVAVFSIHFCNTAGDPLSEGILRIFPDLRSRCHLRIAASCREQLRFPG